MWAVRTARLSQATSMQDAAAQADLMKDIQGHPAFEDLATQQGASISSLTNDVRKQQVSVRPVAAAVAV